MRRRSAFAAGVLAALAIAVAAPMATASGAATQSFCGITWGSLPKSAASTAVSPLTGVRGGRHACVDRLVLDFKGKTTGYHVRYVSQVTQDGSGQVVPVRGGAKLQVTAIAPADDNSGNPTYNPANPKELVNVSGWQTFRQVAWAGSFEGYSDIGLGVRARLPFRVFYLDGPGAGSRLVIDVAHRW